MNYKNYNKLSENNCKFENVELKYAYIPLYEWKYTKKTKKKKVTKWGK